MINQTKAKEVSTSIWFEFTTLQKIQGCVKTSLYLKGSYIDIKKYTENTIIYEKWILSFNIIFLKIYPVNGFLHCRCIEKVFLEVPFMHFLGIIRWALSMCHGQQIFLCLKFDTESWIVFLLGTNLHPCSNIILAKSELNSKCSLSS